MALRTSPEVGGMGHSIKRKEDPRFIRGKGTYVDDVQLPGMLYLDIVRSPYAHAKIVKIDIAKAMATPGVLAVITGKDLEKYNLHWMPTLMSDTQMVLPVDKVMYQAQEVAAVLATSRYAAADGAAAVTVEYDPLPVVVDPKKALEPGAPVLRTDKKDKKDNHIWHWEWGDRAATDRAFTQADVTVKQDIYIPRIHVASIETCGCVAHFDKVNDKLTVWMTTQAPHAIRTVFALVAGHECEDCADRVGRLGRHPHGELVVDLVEVRDAPARLDGRDVDARNVDVLLDGHVRLGEGAIGGSPVAPFPVPDVVILLVLLVGAQHRGPGLERLLRVDDHGQRLVLDLHRGDAVGGRVPARREHGCDLLGLVHHLFHREHHLGVRHECRHPVKVVLGEVLARDDG